MKKLAGANPNLSYEERKAIFAEYALADSNDDAAVASHLEKSGDVFEHLVQQVRDEYCAESISSWL
jgi:acetyl-CoA carboxylase/biotin carboxylase 1